jgi:hypothetical protein
VWLGTKLFPPCWSLSAFATLWKRAIRLATEVECMTISKPKLIYSLERAVPAGPMESKDKMRWVPRIREGNEPGQMCTVKLRTD